MTISDIAWVLLRVLCAFVPLALARVFLLSRKKFPAELGLCPLHQERCGVRVDGLYFQSPLARFAVYEEFLVIGCRDRILLRYDEIERVEIKPYYLTLALYICHARSDYPGDIMICPSTREGLTVLSRTPCADRIGGWRLTEDGKWKSRRGYNLSIFRSIDSYSVRAIFQ